MPLGLAEMIILGLVFLAVVLVLIEVGLLPLGKAIKKDIDHVRKQANKVDRLK